MVNCKFIKLMSEKSGGKGEEKRLVEKKKMRKSHWNCKVCQVATARFW